MDNLSDKVYEVKSRFPLFMDSLVNKNDKPVVTLSLNFELLTMNIHRVDCEVQESGSNLRNRKGFFKSTPLVFYTLSPSLSLCSIHIQASEKMSVTASRDGGLEGLEVHGILQLRVANQEDGLIKIHVDNNDDKGAQLQVIDALYTARLCVSISCNVAHLTPMCRIVA